jgi:hypothetical protein
LPAPISAIFLRAIPSPLVVTVDGKVAYAL